MATATDNNDFRSSWLLDTASDTNVCNDLSCFSTYTPYDQPIQKLTGDASSTALRKGIAIVNAKLHDGTKVSYHFKNVEYIPGMHTNLVSMGHLRRKGVRLDGLNERLVENGMEWCQLLVKDDLYFIDYSTKARADPGFSMSSAVMAVRTRPAASTASAELWHSRLGHAGPETLQHALENSKTGVQIRGPATCECAVCAKAKAHRIQWKEPQRQRTSQPFGHLALDLIQYEPAFNGSRYLFHATCRVTRMRTALDLRAKDTSELWQALANLSHRIGRQFDLSVRFIQCDNERGFGISQTIQIFK